MQELEDDVWTRRGVTILWDSGALGDICHDSSEIVSLRQLFAFPKNWPDEPPSLGGYATITAGLEGCLDRLLVHDAWQWVEDSLRPLLHRYQTNYDNGAALIFWMPTGEKRVEVVALDDSVAWKCEHPQLGKFFPLSKSIFGGAFQEVLKVVSQHRDSKGRIHSKWIGIYLPRIS